MDGEAAVCLSQGGQDQSCTDGSAARQALHSHLVSITQYLAARKIIPHPNGTIRYGCKEFSACSSSRFNGLSRRELQLPSVILHKACFQQPSTEQTACRRVSSRPW